MSFSGAAQNGFIDQTIINSIINSPDKNTDSWHAYTDTEIFNINKIMSKPIKSILIKIHPSIFDKISEEFGPFTQSSSHSEIYHGKDPFTTFYVTEKASLTEFEIMTLPNLPKLF